ncbi:MAG: hypothetical protein HN471_04360 [Cryomorphaceae bacterium]|jgi:hypothetical protein|nr:hypothetical protein [Cryomorphaceae bacterium]MBT6213952.1 hypothetical protein [Cryomorphaceae bacterium]MBT7018562.1 hypothetical protein [Cryomorphaceae bacterium]MBT7546689.1 hypothetical protein [Cryomorphaceae bacterium]
MKTFYASILFFIIVSCNTKQTESLKWTEEEKDLTYKECITYTMDVMDMNLDESNSYCQCSIDVLTSNFENNEDARIKIENDKSLRLLFEACEG